MRICKSFTFDAAHRLDKLPPDHKCHRLHGHTYKVEIVVQGPLDNLGMVANYDELSAVWKPLHDALDHRYLNEIPGLECPTTENLAAFIFERLCKENLNARTHPWPGNEEGLSAFASVKTVRVFESATTYAEYP